MPPRSPGHAWTALKLRFISCAPALLVACSMGHGDGMGGMHGNLPPPARVVVPEPWSGALAMDPLADDNADPKIVEVSLRAGTAEIEYLPGTRTQVWAYNGKVPGPMIRAKVGDEIVVHFSNELPEPTTIHWHGVRVPSAMDGTALMQTPIQPGSSFEYRFTALDAGTFWYHPHIRSDFQVEKGLYGTIVIDDPASPVIPSVADEVVVLDDLLVDPSTGGIDMSVGTRAAMMGREGNLALVNGTRSNVELSVRAGETRRWRIVNTANARFFRLALSAGTMYRIAGDAALLERAEPVKELLLVNGQRADVLVSVNEAGTTAVLRALPHERAIGAGSSEGIDLIRLVASSEPVAPPVALPDKLGTVSPVAPSLRTRSFRLGEQMAHHVWAFTINDAVFPNVPAVDSSSGDTESWQLVNESEMDHPFHLHGFFFWVPDQNEWRDTVNIPAKTTVELRPHFDARSGATGSWVYHCHILEHAEGGMMGELRVR